MLKRNLAPFSDAAWALIDQEAKRVIELNLGGRRAVDIDGPHGWKLGAADTGRLEILSTEPVEGVKAGKRIVQPLIEIRIPFVLDIMDLDSVERGLKNPHLDAVKGAAEKAARAEDEAVFNGWAPGGIAGIAAASPHAPVSLPEAAGGYPRAIVGAVEVLRRAGVNGPYAMALEPRIYDDIFGSAEDCYPVLQRIRTIIEGAIVRAPAVRGGIVLSARGGDFVLTVGQDFSVGYAWHEKHKVELYVTESFAFRVLEPTAAVVLRAGKA